MLHVLYGFGNGVNFLHLKLGAAFFLSGAF